MIVIALSFGTGYPNKEIARAAKKEGGIIIAQKEVAKYIDKCSVISEHRDKGKYLDTVEVLSQASKWINSKEEIVLVAHADHLKRVWDTANYLGINISRGVKGSFSYNPKSKQWWTRNELVFKIWNIIASIYLKIKNYLGFW